MSEKDKKLIEKLVENIKKIPPEKKEYISGIADAFVMCQCDTKEDGDEE